ncbi:glycoside hydrolase [Bimuria novae-zelandiae CBS 107.79]|uniref:Glycoside hydrolase n=1 Tax=Bimuria novae-zelandiae CBS 107.79 TaxID=1447943 RepID=A0A6A5V8J8_9PLEO|nr:glycoside hydrolase [Bimuria novae-zelandiae CBS 107.79]
MYLMVDVVPNHMAFPGCPDKVDYGRFKVLKAEHFHNYCPMQDMANQTEVEDCWLGDCNMAMPDIKTENPQVAHEMNAWIKALVSNYSIDGLRIDSVKNVNKDFFPPFCQSAGVFCMGEVSEGLASYTYPYQAYMDSVLDYPLYYAITRVFQQQSTQNGDTGCKDPTLLGTFFENHDNPRFPQETSDLSLVKNVLALTVLGDGIPIVYQGQEQHYAGGDDPLSRSAVTRVLSYTATEIQLRKDAVRTVLSSQGEEAPTWTLTTQGMEFEKGKTVVDMLGCAKYCVGGDGEVDVKMEAGKPVVLVEEWALGGSSLCGY